MSAPLPKLPDERFELVGVLGEGGMATVYRALDRETQEWCAVKVLHPKFIDKPRVRKRFVTEANAMMRLRHRNVVHVMYLKGDTIQPYFAMELAQGGCAVEWLADHGPMPPKMAVDVLIQVCKGLGAAHRQGVIHRDVKPHNILVNRRGVCKITDFGIAQLDDNQASLTRTGSVMGTLGYIAPEQRTNAKDVDERSDVYSVGATLFTMLTARTTMDLFFADQEPDMLNGVHEALVPIVMKATRYRREERHQTMRELAKELYHSKALLPDDPEDTPSIVMHDLDEHTDELRSMSEVTSDTPFSELSLQTTPPSNDGLEGTLGTITPRNVSTTPGIPRAQLLREQEEEEWRQQRSIVLRSALLAAIPLVLIASSVLGLGIVGRSAISERVSVVRQNHQTLEQTLTAEYPLVQEMAEIGVAREPLEAQWAAWQATTGNDRQSRVEALVLTYRKLLQQHEPSAGSSRVHLARKAAARVERIDESLRKVQAASNALDDKAETIPGRVALALGLADKTI